MVFTNNESIRIKPKIAKMPLKKTSNRRFLKMLNKA